MRDFVKKLIIDSGSRLKLHDIDPDYLGSHEFGCWGGPGRGRTRRPGRTARRATGPPRGTGRRVPVPTLHSFRRPRDTTVTVDPTRAVLTESASAVSGVLLVHSATVRGD
jgi:hypothetical protein